MRPTKSLIIFVGTLLAVFALPAWALTEWTFTCSVDCSNTIPTGTGASVYGNTRTATPAGVTAKAFSDTGNNVTMNSVVQGRALETAYLSWWNDSQGNVPPTGGLGVTNRDLCTTSGCSGDYLEGSSPEHAMDNNGRWDAILFSFNEAINLTEVGLSWSSNDSDISVLAYQPGKLGGPAYTNPAAPNLADGSTTYGGSTGLIAEGWALVGNYADVQTRADATAQLGTDKVSSYWLVMAYNTVFSSYGCNTTGTSSPSTATCTNGTTSNYDYVKVSLVGGNKPTNGTPEPGSMALLGTLLAGAAWMRRRKVTV